MATPVTMYKANDGTVFPDLKAAIQHEQTAFFQSGLSPLLARLLAGSVPEESVSAIADELTTRMSAEAALLADFKKFFSKAQDTSSPPVARKRAPRVRAKKPAAASPPADPAPSAQAQGVGGDAPSEDQLSALDSLAGDPIALPEFEQAPPPPPPAAVAV